MNRKRTSLISNWFLEGVCLSRRPRTEFLFNPVPIDVDSCVGNKKPVDGPQQFVSFFDHALKTTLKIIAK